MKKVLTMLCLFLLLSCTDNKKESGKLYKQLKSLTEKSLFISVKTVSTFTNYLRSKTFHSDNDNLTYNVGSMDDMFDLLFKEFNINKNKNIIPEYINICEEQYRKINQNDDAGKLLSDIYKESIILAKLSINPISEIKKLTSKDKIDDIRFSRIYTQEVIELGKDIEQKMQIFETKYPEYISK